VSEEAQHVSEGEDGRYCPYAACPVPNQIANDEADSEEYVRQEKVLFFVVYCFSECCAAQKNNCVTHSGAAYEKSQNPAKDKHDEEQRLHPGIGDVHHAITFLYAGIKTFFSMLLKILGAADFFSAIALVMLHFDFISSRIALVFAAYLLLKAFAFMKDLASIADIIAAAYFVLLVFGIGHAFITAVLAVYLAQKAVVSFL